MSVRFGRMEPDRNPGVFRKVGISNFQIRNRIAGQGGMAFETVTVRHMGEESASPIVFAVSPQVRQGIIGIGIHRQLLEAVREYDIARIASSFNRVFVKTNGEIIPAVLSWQELGKLSSDLGVEMADLTYYLLEASDSGLSVSQDKNDPKSLSNVEIRRRIFDYATRAADAPPPVLYADVKIEDRTFLLCNDGSGSPVNVGFPDGQAFAKYALAKVEFTSIEEMRVSVQQRSLHIINSKSTLTIENPFRRIEAVSQKPLQTWLSRTNESKAIQLWLFKDGVLDPKAKIVERMLGDGGVITLTQKESIPYKLTGMMDLVHAGVVGKVKVLLGEEAIDGKLQKTARLFRMRHDPLAQPEKCLAVFVLSSWGNIGVKILTEFKK